MENHNGPVHVIRCGNIKAACWLNSTQAGYFYNTTISSQYKDKSTDEWGDTNSFSDRELLAVAHAAQEMYRWICEKKMAANTPAPTDT